jgi:hypothetical protein
MPEFAGGPISGWQASEDAVKQLIARSADTSLPSALTEQEAAAFASSLTRFLEANAGAGNAEDSAGLPEGSRSCSTKSTPLSRIPISAFAGSWAGVGSCSTALRKRNWRRAPARSVACARSRKFQVMVSSNLRRVKRHGLRTGLCSTVRNGRWPRRDHGISWPPLTSMIWPMM